MVTYINHSPGMPKVSHSILTFPLPLHLLSECVDCDYDFDC